MAWPLAITGVIFLLREPLIRLLPSVDNMQYGDFSIQFRQKVQELAEDSKELLSENKESEDISPVNLEEYLLNLAVLSPRSAVIESWLNLEAWAKNRLSHEEDIKDNSLKKLGGYALEMELLTRNILNKNEINAFQRLRELRNQAVHMAEKEFTDNVESYIQLSLALAVSIRKSFHPAHVSQKKA